MTGKTVGGFRIYPKRNCLDRETAVEQAALDHTLPGFSTLFELDDTSAKFPIGCGHCRVHAERCGSAAALGDCDDIAVNAFVLSAAQNDVRHCFVTKR